MPKSLGLDIVIGASVGAALKSIDLVTNSTKVLGTAIEKLNSKKLNILEGIDKEFSAKLEPIENELNKFYEKQKDIKLKISIKDNEIKEFRKKIKDTEKEIKSLEKEKLNLEKEFKKGKISAEEFEAKTKEIERELTKLQKKKLGLDSKLQLTTKKSTMLKNSLNSVNKTIDNLKNKRLKLADELEKAKEEAIKANREIKKLGGSIKSLENRKLKIELNLEKRENLKKKFWDTVAIGASVAIPFKAGIEFESEMARVKALSGATKEEFKKLQDTAKKLGSTTVFSSSEAAKGMQFLAMAGFKTNEIIKAMPGLLDLAAAGQIDLVTTADITSNILSGFGITADKTTHVADVLAKAMTTANVDVRMLGETMKYVAPAASSLGASLEEVTTLAAKLGDVGIQGSNAGTALRSMYLRMASPPSEARKTIAKLGLQIKDANGNFIGMFKVIEQLQQKTKHLSNTQKATILKNLFGMEAMSAASALLNQPIEKLREYEKALQNADGTAKEIAKTQTDTVAGSFKALGSALEGVSIAFSSLFLPAIKTATNGITWLTQKINTFVEEHKTLATIIGGAVAGFGALTVASFALGYAATFVANTYHKSVVAFTLLRNATLLLASAEGRATIQTKFLSFWSGVLNTKAKLVTLSKTAWAIATSALSKSMGILGGTLRFVGNGVLWFGRALMANPIGLAITAIAAGAYLVWNNWDKLKNFFSGLWSNIKSTFTSALTEIKSVLQSGWNFIKNVISFSPLGIIANNWSAIKNYFSNFWNWLKGKFNTGITFVSNIFSKPVETISAIWSNLANWFSGFWGSLKSGFSKGVNTITNIFLHPINTIQNLWNKLLGWISKKIEWISSIGSKIKKFFGFGGDEEKKLTLKPVVEKVKPIVTATALATTATAQPLNTQVKPITQVSPVVTPKVINPTINPKVSPVVKPVKVKSIEPVKPVSVPVNTQVQNVKNTQTTPQTIVYNFNFGDIKVETKDGKIANPEELKEQVKQIIEEINFERNQRSLSDVV